MHFVNIGPVISDEKIFGGDHVVITIIPKIIINVSFPQS
jgi:hypothetical protein